ncbi:MAG TPA: hypothetical protein VFI31_22105 [Pirellulales bacterium]|nr:hypothetical protein [Pirellulales bacterium]
MSRRFQFSLTWLFCLTATIALAAAVLRSLTVDSEPNPYLIHAAIIALIVWAAALFK